MKWKCLILSAVIGSVAAATAQPSSKPSIPSDAEIRAILADRIENGHQSLGIVVGIIEPGGRRVVSYGVVDKGDKRALDGDTIFEIGAITKVFTALLLTDMAQHREVGLTDPVLKFLPKTLKAQERVQRITLQDLATHTSGLPRNPVNLVPADTENPYAAYSSRQLYDFLSAYRPSRDPGTEFEYSNVGFGLLGHVLSLRTRMSYEALVHNRIAAPLGMKSTGIALSRDMAARQAVGHNSQMSAVPAWDFDVLAGAGALRSTTNDMLTFLGAAMGYSKSALTPAMEAMLKVRRPTTTNGLDNALGWQVLTFNGRQIVEKDGAALSGGYSTFVAYDAADRVGVVVLSNMLTNTGVSDIGLHLLDKRFPLCGRQQKEVTVNPKLFDGYVGVYRFSPTRVLTVTRQDNHLFAEMTGQPKFEIFPQSDREYFYRAFDAQLTFETDDAGRGIAVTLYYNGRNTRAQRIEPAASSERH